MDITFTKNQKEVRKIKQPKKLTLDQKKLLSRCGLRPEDWMCKFEDKYYLHVISRNMNELAIVDKFTLEVMKSNCIQDKSRIDQNKRDLSDLDC